MCRTNKNTNVFLFVVTFLSITKRQFRLFIAADVTHAEQHQKIFVLFIFYGDICN